MTVAIPCVDENVTRVSAEASAAPAGPTNAELVALHGDPRDELMDHLPALRAFAVSLTRNISDADDIVQDCIVKAWSNIDKFTPGTNLQAWLFTILRNTFFSRTRKRRREVADPDGIYAQRLSVAPAHDAKLAMNDFKRAFDVLTPEHREVLILVGASGYSCEEAAAMMGVAVGTVKSRANRARNRLCELMGLKPGEDVMGGSNGVSLAALAQAGNNAA
jgi:RNA polymerase sigma-70 factor, ECF subfamily